MKTDEEITVIMLDSAYKATYDDPELDKLFLIERIRYEEYLAFGLDRDGNIVNESLKKTWEIAMDKAIDYRVSKFGF